jgi:hypothetical protein
MFYLILFDGFMVICQADPLMLVVKQKVSIIEKKDVDLPIVAGALA